MDANDQNNFALVGKCQKMPKCQIMKYEYARIKIAYRGAYIKRRWPVIYLCFVRKKTNQNVTGFPEVFQFLNIVLRSHLIKRTL